jgi:alpha-ketoglutarate-dependent taurine dioxygenase
LQQKVDRDGFCVLRAWDTQTETLKTIANLFGDIQSHIRADSAGVVGGGEPVDSTWKEHRGEYQGLTEEEFGPHTDGSFLDGALPLEGGGLVRIGPPKMVLLQCVRAAGEGGTNLVIDSQPILEEILLTKASLAKTLLTRGCITFCRDDQLALDCPVYEHVSDGRFRVRFRLDAKAYAPAWSIDALRELHDTYYRNPRYATSVALSPGDILIMDNFRVLHGREAFKPDTSATGSRKLRRVWINNDDAPVLANANRELATHRGLDPYVPYRAIANSGPACVPVRGGSRLSDQARAVAHKLLTDLGRSPAPN